MFSGLVLGQGRLHSIRRVGDRHRIGVKHERMLCGVRLGDSVAVNGCCLTVVRRGADLLEFDLLEETWKRTSFHAAKIGERVNLESSLRLGDVVGGHLVTGHVDESARIVGVQKKGGDVLMEVAPSRRFLRWVVPKGAVAIDGVSLTVGGVKAESFRVWLIPHTLKLTTLGWKQKGAWVNLEGDMLAKYVQKACRFR